MKKTRFDQNLWGLKQFNEIGYDKVQRKLFIFYFSGKVLEFQQVKEEDIFAFITSPDKEDLVEHSFKKCFPFIQHQSLTTLSS
ncbi:KTSC domain-containing protein [Salinibacillus kushneri]|uniref:KTSC domain-containing protein n=1 Tax=Salinibacillus kushneri TaxID=237682 RepID=A0A1I0G5H6_9BACI|nr:KTSC domain-containing protein [Salinibacillus kushneri]SET65996.1 KTSC domain-containing protein [Salinibacillus kushneri]